MGEGTSQAALFLHGGPGLSSAVERLWFGQSLPIRWWDQPPVGAATSAFDALVKAATAEVRAMAATAPVHLVAHSFGGQIAYALARDLPHLIRHITLLGCVFDPLAGIVRLAQRLAKLDGSSAVAGAVATAQADMNGNNFADMVAVAAGSPSYPAVYFGPGSKPVLDRFLTLMRQVDFLDMGTFLRVMSEFLERPPLAPLPDYVGPVDLLLGRHDPVLTLDSDAAAWAGIFPQLKVLTVEAGHLVHLETAPDVWLGERGR